MVLTRWFEKRPVHIRARRIASKNALYTWLVDETVPLGGGEPPLNRRPSTEGVSVEILSCRSNVISFMWGDRRKMSHSEAISINFTNWGIGKYNNANNINLLTINKFMEISYSFVGNFGNFLKVKSFNLTFEKCTSNKFRFGKIMAKLILQYFHESVFFIVKKIFAFFNNY